jgi:hypothetical protein
MLAYGFNHDAAERSFLRATELDPECAMCWWGAALVLGPHVNSTMDPANNDKAWQRLQRARRWRRRRRARARLDRGAGARYDERPPMDRKAWTKPGRAHRQARRRVPRRPRRGDLPRRGDDGHAAVEYYDAQLQAEGPYRRDRVHAGIGDAARPDHPGALHLYVHAVEASAIRSAAWRRRSAAHADPGLRPPGAHARAHLLARRPLA